MTGDLESKAGTESPRPPTTADLLDENPELVVLEPVFRDYGGKTRFHGLIRTCTAPEDNGCVREMLSESGQGCVLLVDGGGSLRCALRGLANLPSACAPER